MLLDVSDKLNVYVGVLLGVLDGVWAPDRLNVSEELGVGLGDELGVLDALGV